jgi:hypothetical protein
MQLHLDIYHRDWRHDLVWPLAAIVLPIALSVVFHREWLLLIFPVAFGVGYVLRPAHPYLVWLGSVVMYLAIDGAAVLTGVIEGKADDPDQSETILTYGAEAIVFMAVLVLLPLGIARLVRVWRPAE